MSSPRDPSNPPISGYGTDRAESGPNGSRLLFCQVTKNWRSRKPATRTSAEHPGAAVRWQEEIFEVVEAVPTPHGGMRYRLEPWDLRHAIRVMETYDAAAEGQRRAEQVGRRDALHKRRLSIVLAPILGHLPGPVQEKMEGDFGAPARAMTIVSALPFLVIGLLGVLARLAAGFCASLGFPIWLAPPFLLASYWVLESALRLFAALVQGHPMGSLIGVLGFELWRKSSGRSRATPRLESRPAQPQWKAEDSYKMLEPLLAVLAPEEQEILERRFAFDRLKWGRRSAVAVGIVAALNVIISLGAIAQGRDTFWDALWLVAGGYLCIEQILRLRTLAGGRPAGSILGALVRPLARNLLSPAAPGA